MTTEIPPAHETPEQDAIAADDPMAGSARTTLELERMRLEKDTIAGTATPDHQ